MDSYGDEATEAYLIGYFNGMGHVDPGMEAFSSAIRNGSLGNLVALSQQPDCG